MIRVFLIGICIIFYNNVVSQQIKFKTLTTSDGLSNNSVIDIISDANGGLWFGTYDGLNYYDGKNFKVFKHIKDDKTSISGNYITNIIRDNSGFIWIQNKQKVISKYIGNGRFENFYFDKAINALFISKDQKVVVLSLGSYFEYNGKTFKLVPEVEKQFYKDNTTLKKILLKKRPDVFINDVLKDKKGNIWYATKNHGLFYIDNKSNTESKGYIKNYLHDAYNEYAFKSNEIERVFEDDSGHIWLAHKDGGVSMAYSNSDKINTVTPHPIKNTSLPNETVRAIAKNEDNVLWLGYYSKGIYFYDKLKQDYRHFIIKEAALNKDWNRIRSMYLDSEGALWIGTYAGLVKIKNGKYNLYEPKKANAFFNGRNYSIVEDNAKNLWVSCWSGVSKFNIKENKFVTFKGQDSFKNLNIRHLSFYHNELIISTELNGVFLLNTETGAIQKINTKNNILSNSIYYVYKDYLANNYWIATSGGISIYNKKEGVIKNITENDGLPSHVVYTLLPNNSKIWLSTAKGVAVVDKNNYDVKNFPAKEGWQGAEFSEGAYYQDSNGTIYFGGANGFSYFQPSIMDLSSKKPKIKLSVNGNDKYNKNQVKPYSQNNIKIDVTPIIFEGDQNLKIFYKLEGVDDVWKTVSKNQAISYFNIPSGAYKFKVKYKDEANTPLQTKFSLLIEKPYYSTVWFYFLVVLVLILLMAFYVYKKSLNSKKRQKELENEITERTALIRKQTITLQATNAKLDDKNKEILRQKEELLAIHNNLKTEDFELEKFKTFAFSEFQEPISKIRKASDEIDDVKKLKSVIHKESKKFLGIMNEWFYLDHIKDLSHSKASAVLLKALLNNLLEALNVKLKKSNIGFNYTIDTAAVSYLEIDVLRFKLLFQYLFHDILKYSESNSLLNLKVAYKAHNLVFYIDSTSYVLIDNWEVVTQYSPYFKASKILISDLNAIVNLNLEKRFELSLKIPVKALSTEKSTPEVVLWKHMQLDETLPKNKNNILVYTESTNFDIVKQLLDNNDNFLIFESDALALVSAVKHLKVSMLLLYNVALTNNIVTLISNLNKKKNKLYIPVVFLSEHINYIEDQQFIDLDLDLKLTMPISQELLHKKIKKTFTKQEKINQKLEKDGLYEHINSKDDFLSVNEKLVKKALFLIKDNLHDAAFNVERLVEVLGISRIKCYRVFKETLRQAPSEIILSLRIEKAEYLLRKKKLNISEVGFECGFNDPKYFSKTFKKHNGVSPKVFIKEMT